MTLESVNNYFISSAYLVDRCKQYLDTRELPPDVIFGSSDCFIYDIIYEEECPCGQCCHTLPDSLGCEAVFENILR